MARIVSSKNTRNPFLKEVANKISAKNNTSLYNKIANYIEDNSKDYYLGFGGMGDALLVLGNAWNNPRARIIFFGNGGSIPFIKDFFNLFNIQHLIEVNIMGQQIANKIFDLITKSKNFKTSGHLADGLYYGDWANYKKYIPRIVKHVPWKEKLGSVPSTKRVIIGPSGSHRTHDRQRFLEWNQFNTLKNKLTEKGYDVVTTGSPNDLDYLNIRGKSGFHFISSNFVQTNDGKRIPADLRKMLQIINSSELVISTDTWLKTYSAMIGIPTKVIKTKWNGKYKDIGEDSTDWIFLNKEIWPCIENIKFEELIKSI